MGRHPPTPELCNLVGSNLQYTTPVDRYPEGASPYGCWDMMGNVIEWCLNKWKDYPYNANDGREDLRDIEGSEMVVRGSWWLNRENYEHISSRGPLKPEVEYPYLGFRCVMTNSNSVQSKLPNRKPWWKFWQ